MGRRMVGGARRTTVGLLYPGHAAEDDYPRLERVLGPAVRLVVVHTSVGEDAHRVDALLDLGSHERLAAGARALAPHHVDAVVWACTSGSFVYGWDGARGQVDALGRAAGAPATSTSLAFVRAAHALGVRRVSIGATYPAEVAGHFADFLRAGGLEVAAASDRGIVTAAEVGTLGHDDVLSLTVANDHPGAEAVLLPDTALHTAAWLDELEQAVNKPVLTANQVSVWDGLRAAGHTVTAPGVGALFRATVHAGTPHRTRGVTR